MPNGDHYYDAYYVGDKEATRSASLCLLAERLENEGLLKKYAHPGLIKWYDEYKKDEEKSIRLNLEIIYKSDPNQSPDEVAEEFLKDHVHYGRKGLFNPEEVERYRSLLHKIAREINKNITEKSRVRKLGLEKLTVEERKALDL